MVNTKNNNDKSKKLLGLVSQHILNQNVYDVEKYYLIAIAQ